jgi:DNA-binding CsgD family transcriptional regulator
MTSRRIRCSCGTRLKLPKGQPMPICTHRALTLAQDPAFVRGPADYYQFFAPRLAYEDRLADRRGARGTGGGRRVSIIPKDPQAGPMDGVGADERMRAEYIKAGPVQGLGPAAKGPIRSAREERAIRRAERDEIREAREARQLAGQIRQRDVRRREWASILPHLSQATDKQRDAYRLHIEQGHSFKEIASLLGISEDAVKDRLRKARAHELTSRRRAQIA